MWNLQKNVRWAQKSFYKWIKHGFASEPESKRHGMETLSSKEKVPDAAVSKEGYAHSVLEHERAHHSTSHCNVSYCQYRQNSIPLQNDPYVYINWCSKQVFYFLQLSISWIVNYLFPSQEIIRYNNIKASQNCYLYYTISSCSIFMVLYDFL